MVEVEPGWRRVSTVFGRHEKILEIEAAPHSSYFVELRLQRFTWSVRFGPSL